MDDLKSDIDDPSMIEPLKIDDSSQQHPVVDVKAGLERSQSSIINHQPRTDHQFQISDPQCVYPACVAANLTEYSRSSHVSFRRPPPAESDSMVKVNCSTGSVSIRKVISTRPR